MDVGDERTLSVKAWDTNGKPVTDPPVSWTIPCCNFLAFNPSALTVRGVGDGAGWMQAEWIVAPPEIPAPPETLRLRVYERRYLGPVPARVTATYRYYDQSITCEGTHVLPTLGFASVSSIVDNSWWPSPAGRLRLVIAPSVDGTGESPLLHVTCSNGDEFYDNVPWFPVARDLGASPFSWSDTYWLTPVTWENLSVDGRFDLETVSGTIVRTRNTEISNGDRLLSHFTWTWSMQLSIPHNRSW